MTIIGQQNRSESLDVTYDRYGLDPSNIPAHLAVIMDGNGRWAQNRHLPRVSGHKKGERGLRQLIESCILLNIHYLSVYAFSTENWRRPQTEVSFLMSFFKIMFAQTEEELFQNGVRVRVLGDVSGLDDELQAIIRRVENRTAQNTVFQLNMCINYGARHELVRACQRIVEDAVAPEDITESLLSSYLYTADLPDPDILIRTGGDYRISNFLLWQLAYAELFFVDVLWPDFNMDVLIPVLKQYQNRERRFGGVISR